MTTGTRSTTPDFFKDAAEIPAARSSFLPKKLCEKVSRALIASQRKTAEEGRDLLDFLNSYRQWYKDEGATEISLPTLNQTTINGLHFSGTQKKAIIYLHGNGCFYETSLEKPLSWRKDLDMSPHLVVCNPGGTGKSEGNTHPDTVARELLAQFEYLVREHGIDPNEIVIAGHSMGGYLGAFGAELIQQRFPTAQINFISLNSFDSIYSRVSANDHFFLVNKIIKLIKCIGIFLTRWARNPIAAMESLKGRVCVVYHQQDKVIPYVQSTYSALLGTKRSRTYTTFEMTDMTNPDVHNREFTETEEKTIVTELKRMLRIPLTKEEELLQIGAINP